MIISLPIHPQRKDYFFTHFTMFYKQSESKRSRVVNLATHLRLCPATMTKQVCADSVMKRQPVIVVLVMKLQASLGPFSSTSSSNNSNTGSCSRSATKAYLNRLMKLKPDYDGPIIHGPFFCDCPGGLDFCKQESLPMHSTDW